MSMYIQSISKSNGLRNSTVDFKRVDAIEIGKEESVEGFRVTRTGAVGVVGVGRERVMCVCEGEGEG